MSEDDLRAIAKRGYEGAVTTDHGRQAQAVGLFLNDAPANLTAQTTVEAVGLFISDTIACLDLAG